MEGLLRITCPRCSKYRTFREADLFVDVHDQVVVTGDLATITKPCPYCASETAIRIRRPPEQLPHRTVTQQFSFPIPPSSN